LDKAAARRVWLRKGDVASAAEVELKTSGLFGETFVQ
jgi:hypothetical protein